MKSTTKKFKMKLLESSRFEAINNALTIQNGDISIIGRIESYSCKMAKNDKQLYKRFISPDQSASDLQALSPPQTVFDMSPLFARGSYSGDEGVTLCDTISRKTLFYLIATLNSTFEPDYDFSDAKVSLQSRKFFVHSLDPFCNSIWKTSRTHTHGEILHRRRNHTITHEQMMKKKWWTMKSSNKCFVYSYDDGALVGKWRDN